MEKLFSWYEIEEPGISFTRLYSNRFTATICILGKGNRVSAFSHTRRKSVITGNYIKFLKDYLTQTAVLDTLHATVFAPLHCINMYSCKGKSNVAAFSPTRRKRAVTVIAFS